MNSILSPWAFYEHGDTYTCGPENNDKDPQCIDEDNEEVECDFRRILRVGK